MSLTKHAPGRDKAEAKQTSPRAESKSPEGFATHTPHAAVIQRAERAPGSLTPRDVLQLQRAVGNRAAARLLSRASRRPPTPPGENATGLPDALKAGIENLSGLSMDDVRVHYNSGEPARVQALAYTQGTHIHVGPGQERHLPHEAWHVVQQKRGQVKPMRKVKGVSVNDDAGMEREADAWGARAALTGVGRGRGRADDCPSSPESSVTGLNARGVGDASAPLQLVKQPPVGNFGRYVAGNVTNSGITAGVHPNDAEVATESAFNANSAPVNSYGWAATNPNNYTLTGATGVNNTRINIDPRVDHNGNILIRMHLIHHRLAANANNNQNNIVLGPHAFNMFHVNHVENFMGDSIARNFYTSSGSTSLNAALLVGEATGIAPAGHANAGSPYVVGAAPTFPAGLRTGVTLATTHGVPANAQQIATDEATLESFVALWYFVRPIFGLAAATLYGNLVGHLNTEYNNRPGGAANWGENIPPGILGAGGMLQNMADALAGIYATGLEVQASFYYPDPEAIPPGGSTADLLPWRENRIPRRTLQNNAGSPYATIYLRYDGGMGVMVNTPAVTVQL